MPARPGDAGRFRDAIPASRAARLRRLLRTLGFGRSLRRAGACGRRAVLLHLDGVSRHVLQHASRAGYVPFLTQLLDRGTLQAAPLLAGAPASTSAFQAGLLYGAVRNVPGYLWWDKRRGKSVRMDRSADVRELEERHGARGPGLLAGGTSYSTLFSGDASPPILNLGRAISLQWHSNFRHWPLLAAAGVQGALGVRLWARLLVDIPRFLASGAAWATRVGRHEWEWRLFCMRLLTSIPLREMATWGTIGDMALGAPVIYTCFVEYDEVAHRRGPLHPEALGHLRSMDACVEKIVTAAAALPELGYDVYVLSDHGMAESTPFAAIDGRDLPAFLRDAIGGPSASERHRMLRELGDSLPPPFAWMAHQAARRDGRSAPPGMEVVDAGDLAHLYFTDDRDALPIEAIRSRHRDVLDALRASPAVPMIMARSAHGPVAITGTRIHHLRDAADRAALVAQPLFRDRDEETLLAYLERVIGMRSSGDLVLFGNAGKTRTIAYSWEFGSHGGLAASEIDAFMLHPPDVEFDFAAVRFPEELHRWFVRYRPPLPREQDRATEVVAIDPALREAALRALREGTALPDASPHALDTGCDAPPP